VLAEADEPTASQEAIVIRANPEASRATGFCLNDLLSLDDEHLRLLLDDVDDEDLAIALTAASGAVRRRVLGVLPQPRATEVETRVQSHSPVHVADVESAEACILRVLHRLEAAGEVALQKGSIS
jgi:flagellar motor switch protein FliG